MAISTEHQNVSVQSIERSWRFGIDVDPYKPDDNNPATDETADATITVFRETVTIMNGQVVKVDQSYSPLSIRGSELEQLAEYCELSPAVRALLQDPDEDTLKNYLKIMPLIVALTGDAMKRRQEAQQQAQQNSTPPSA